MTRLIESKVKSGSKRTQTGEKIRAREGQTERLFGESQILTIRGRTAIIIEL